MLARNVGIGREGRWRARQSSQEARTVGPSVCRTMPGEDWHFLLLNAWCRTEIDLSLYFHLAAELLPPAAPFSLAASFAPPAAAVLPSGPA